MKDNPPWVHPYKMDPSQLDELRRQLDRLHRCCRIRPSSSPYGAGCLLVKKSNDKWCICVDYRALNTRTVRDRYPLPSIQAIQSTLGGSTVFSRIDLVSWFHQIRIHDEDVEKTPSNTQFDTFEWVVMPFGLCNAPSTFQRVVNDVLRDHLGIFVWVYIDNILVLSKDAEETNDISIWYMNYYVGTNCFPASISPQSSRVEYPFADTSAIKMEYTWTPKRSTSFEVGLRQPPFMKFDNLSGCLNFTRSLSKHSRRDEVWPEPLNHLYVSLRSGPSVWKGPDVDRQAAPALQFDTEPDVELEELEPLLSNEVLAEDSHQSTVHLDDAGNEVPHMSTDTDDLPDIDIDRSLRVPFGKKLRYAPTLTELIRCWRHRDSTLQPVPLPKVGPNTPYPPSLKGTHRRVHRHYQYKDLTSTAVWAAAYRDDARTRHIYQIAARDPTAGHQLRDAKLSFDDGNFFLLSTMGKCVLVPPTLVTLIVAMYHESEFYGQSGLLCAMALIKRDYICSHLQHYVERYILSCDVCQAAKSRRVDTARQPRPLPMPDTKWHSVSVCWVSGLPVTTRGHDTTMTVVNRFSKRGMFIPCRKDMTA